MFKMLQIRIYLFWVVLTSYCVITGENAKCICSEGYEPYITTMTGGAETCKQEISKTNQVTEQLDSLLSNIKEGNALLKSLHSKTIGLQVQCNYPTNCAEAAANSRRSGVYSINVKNFHSNSFEVSCDEDLHGGGWTVVLRRIDGSVDFFREWPDYKKGFGNLEGEFFIGLDKLYALTNGPHTQEVIFVMEDFNNVQKYAKYLSFAIGNETERYVLKTLGKYTGDAGDSFTFHVGQTFKTKEIPDPHNCAKKFTGAWWYKACHVSNLCGRYLKGVYGQDKFAQGIDWYAWHGHNYSLKSAQMMIRPQRL